MCISPAARKSAGQGEDTMTVSATIIVADILPADTRPAGWWRSEDGQGMIDMTGGSIAEAREELLSVCATDEQREEMLGGTIEVLAD
jgi:hypothetical protein